VPQWQLVNARQQRHRAEAVRERLREHRREEARGLEWQFAPRRTNERATAEEARAAKNKGVADFVDSLF